MLEKCVAIPGQVFRDPFVVWMLLGGKLHRCLRVVESMACEPLLVFSPPNTLLNCIDSVVPPGLLLPEGIGTSPLAINVLPDAMASSLSARFHLRFLFRSKDYAAPHKIWLRGDVLTGRS